jgi:hypothetical protein
MEGLIMKVSMNIFGKQADVLARELGLACSNKSADVPMTAHFTYRDVEGHTVVAAEFTSAKSDKTIICKHLEFKDLDVACTLPFNSKNCPLHKDFCGHSDECYSVPDTSPDPVDCNGNEERQLDFQRVERQFDASRGTRGY